MLYIETEKRRSNRKVDKSMPICTCRTKKVFPCLTPVCNHTEIDTFWVFHGYYHFSAVFLTVTQPVKCYIGGEGHFSYSSL